MLDYEIAQHEHQNLNDELQLNLKKVKHLESNITKLYQTAEIWKKSNRKIVIVIQYALPKVLSKNERLLNYEFKIQ